MQAGAAAWATAAAIHAAARCNRDVDRLAASAVQLADCRQLPALARCLLGMLCLRPVQAGAALALCLLPPLAMQQPNIVTLTAVQLPMPLPLLLLTAALPGPGAQMLGGAVRWRRHTATRRVCGWGEHQPARGVIL